MVSILLSALKGELVGEDKDCDRSQLYYHENDDSAIIIKGTGDGAFEGIMRFRDLDPERIQTVKIANPLEVFMMMELLYHGTSVSDHEVKELQSRPSPYAFA